MPGRSAIPGEVSSRAVGCMWGRGRGQRDHQEVPRTSHATSCAGCLSLHGLGFPSDRERTAALLGSWDHYRRDRTCLPSNLALHTHPGLS